MTSLLETYGRMLREGAFRPGTIIPVEDVFMSGGPSREPNILLYTNRLRELNERLAGLTDKVKATADVYGGGVPEPSNERAENKVEQKGLIQSLEYQIDQAVKRFVAVESQFHRLSESL